MEMTYTFYSDADDGTPLELNMLGVNLYTGGHKDRYIAYYHSYEEVESFPQGTFDPPAEVNCDGDLDGLAATARSRPAQVFRSLMPNVHWGHAAYDAFVHRHGRRHGSAREYRDRLTHFSASKRFVENWIAVDGNAASAAKASATKRHRVALNHLADWSREEYRGLLGRRPAGKGRGSSVDAIATVANFTTTPHFLPAEVIWRGTPADGPVKDQAACGSCWAFSSVASLESAVYRTTGRQQLLSEQAMIDCGWEQPGRNTGCFGGDQDRAIAWALRRGGLPALADYPYRGVNDYCRGDVPKVPLPGGTLVGLEGGEDVLKAALLAKGPMAVSVDADGDDFRFYAGGVYANPDCATAAEDLNHAVVAAGYGVAQDGTPYWLVKNMWSPYWGEEGYIRIARAPNDCGISAQPMYVELADG